MMGMKMPPARAVVEGMAGAMSASATARKPGRREAVHGYMRCALAAGVAAAAAASKLGLDRGVHIENASVVAQQHGSAPERASQTERGLAEHLDRKLNSTQSMFT